MSGDFVLPPELEQIKQALSISLPRGQLLKGLFGETKPQQPGEGEIWAWVDALVFDLGADRIAFRTYPLL